MILQTGGAVPSSAVELVLTASTETKVVLVITAVFSRLAVGSSPASARSRNRPGRLKLPKPANPVCRNPRRLPEPDSAASPKTERHPWREG